MLLFLILVTFASAKTKNDTEFDALITFDKIQITGNCILYSLISLTLRSLRPQRQKETNFRL